MGRVLICFVVGVPAAIAAGAVWAAAWQQDFDLAVALVVSLFTFAGGYGIAVSSGR